MTDALIESVARFYGAKRWTEVGPDIDIYHVPYIDEWNELQQVDMDLRPCLISGIRRLVYDPILKLMVYELGTDAAVPSEH